MVKRKLRRIGNKRKPTIHSMKGTKKEENGKNFHLVLIATGTIILNILVGIGQISNA